MSDLRLSPDGPHSDDYTREVANGLSECVRVLNHATQSINGVDYPSTVYEVIGSVHAAVFGLDQLIRQLDARLVDQRDSGQLYDARGLDASMTVAHARQALAETRALLPGLNAQLGRAHSATSELGLRDGAEVLRRAADLITASPRVSPEAAISIAAGELTTSDTAARVLGYMARRALADYLGYAANLNTLSVLAGWKRIRTAEQVIDCMQRAADALDGLPERGGPLPGRAAEDALLDEFEAQQARPDVRGGPPIGDDAEADYDIERGS